MQNSNHSQKEIKTFWEKIREDVVGGPYIVFTRKAVVDQTFIRTSANVSKSIVGIDASQLYPYSMCQPTPTGFYTRWDLDSGTSRFTPQQNKTAAFRIWSSPISHEQEQNVKWKDSLQEADRRKLTAPVFMVFVLIATLFQRRWVVLPLLSLSRAASLPLTEADIQRGSKKREPDASRRHYIQEKGLKVIEMSKCDSWRLYKTTNTVKQHVREHSPYRRSLAAEQLLEEIKKGKLFGQVQCDIEVPENLRENFANIPPTFKNTFVSKSDIKDLMKNYAEEERFLYQPRKMLISSVTLQNGTFINPLLLFYLELDLVCTKIHRFVEYTPNDCFNSFVQSAVDARRQGDENPNTGFVAETNKLLANSSYGYQIYGPKPTDCNEVPH